MKVLKRLESFRFQLAQPSACASALKFPRRFGSSIPSFMVSVSAATERRRPAPHQSCRSASSFLISVIARAGFRPLGQALAQRSEEHTSELQSLLRISYAVFSLTKK